MSIKIIHDIQNFINFFFVLIFCNFSRSQCHPAFTARSRISDREDHRASGGVPAVTSVVRQTLHPRPEVRPGETARRQYAVPEKSARLSPQIPAGI